MIWLILKVVKMGVNFSEQVNISKLSTFMITALHLIISYGKKPCILAAFFIKKWMIYHIGIQNLFKTANINLFFKNRKLISLQHSSFLELNIMSLRGRAAGTSKNKTSPKIFKVLFRPSKHSVASKPWLNGSSEYLKWSLNVF